MAKEDYEIEQDYKDMLDEVYGTVKIAGVRVRHVLRATGVRPYRISSWAIRL